MFAVVFKFNSHLLLIANNVEDLIVGIYINNKKNTSIEKYY